METGAPLPHTIPLPFVETITDPADPTTFFES